jgi:hypothetical protein
MPGCALIVLAPAVDDEDYWHLAKPWLKGMVPPPLHPASLSGWRFWFYYPDADRVSISITQIDGSGEQLLHHLSLPN